MAWKPSQLMLSPFQDKMEEDIVNKVQSPLQTHKPILSPELQIGGSSQFNLPDGWVVEERPRRSNPTHVDKYYYEPHTRKQFRSLSSVRRYLAGEKVHLVTKRTKSKKANTNLIEYGVGQQSSSSKAVDNFLVEENTSIRIPKLPVESGAREKRIGDTTNNGKSVYKPSSVAKEEMITPMSWKHSIPSGKPVKLDYQKKTNPESSRASSVHNLTTLPPPKVTWATSGRTGEWNPMVNSYPVSGSEKSNWSEAFLQAMNRKGPKN